MPADAITGARRRRKNDMRDRRLLMELAWDMDRKQVRQVWQRPRELQEDLTMVRARDAVKRSRSRLTNAARGLVKPYGERIPKCDADYLPKHARETLSAAVLTLVEPLLQGIEALTQQLQQYDRQLAAMLARRHEDARRVEQPRGVGLVATSTYLSVIGDPKRFARSRDVPAYVGCVTRQEQSGESDPQLGISKAGDPLLRRIMVQSAQYILGPFGEDSDLRRWGLKLAGDGKNKARKRKAVMAVARKLMVLLHRLWITGETYEPLRNARLRGEHNKEAVAA